MSRFIFVGDPHLDTKTPMSRKDSYRIATLDQLRALLLMAQGHGVDHVIFTGDFFHRLDIPISYLNELVEILKEFQESNIKVYTVVGNHDIPYNNMKYFNSTPLSLLFRSELLYWLSSAQSIVTRKSVISGLDFTSDISAFERHSEVFPDLKRIIVAHYATQNTVAGDSIPTKEFNQFHLAVLGHDHMYYEPLEKDGVKFYRPGSMFRRTKDEYNLTRKPVVYKYTDGDDEMVELVLPHKPADQIFKSEIFHKEIENFYKNSYADVFRGLSNNREYTDIYEILGDLPIDVDQESIDTITKHLESEGLLQVRILQNPVQESKELDYEDQFSIN